jgi:DNA uptake protein ComE-like DNA-binding protein
VDINRAGLAELKTLPGIGDAEARKIVAGRPWPTKADLVTKGVIDEGKYLAIRNRIVAANPGGPVRARKPPR